MPIMPEIPEMPIIPRRGMGGADFSDESDSLEEGWSIRKETEKFGRELREILVKKGCKEGGVSL